MIYLPKTYVFKSADTQEACPKNRVNENRPVWSWIIRVEWDFYLTKTTLRNWSELVPSATKWIKIFTTEEMNIDAFKGNWTITQNYVQKIGEQS